MNGGTMWLRRLDVSSRRSVFFAQFEATQTGSKWVEPEHLLLGLIHQDQWGKMKIFPRFLRPGTTTDMIRDKALNEIQKDAPHDPATDVPLSAGFKTIMGNALNRWEENAEPVPMECLLLGILGYPKSRACQILAEHGVTHDDVEKFLFPQHT